MASEVFQRFPANAKRDDSRCRSVFDALRVTALVFVNITVNVPQHDQVTSIRITSTRIRISIGCGRKICIKHTRLALLLLLIASVNGVFRHHHKSQRQLLRPRGMSKKNLCKEARGWGPQKLLLDLPSGRIEFISENIWDPRIAAELKLQYRPRTRPQQPCAKVRIEVIPPDTEHPAAGQCGLFAAQTLHPGEHILDYLGFVTTEEHAEDSEYVAQLAPGILINAHKYGNEARFINDFHGTRKMPNVRFQLRVDERGEHRLGVHVMKRKILKREELLITYGWGYGL